MILIIYNQTSNIRPYAPMSMKDVQYVYQKQKEFKSLMAVRQIALQIGDKVKAMRCRTAAEAISRDLKLKYDIIL